MIRPLVHSIYNKPTSHWILISKRLSKPYVCIGRYQNHRIELKINIDF